MAGVNLEAHEALLRLDALQFGEAAQLPVQLAGRDLQSFLKRQLKGRLDISNSPGYILIKIG